MVTASVTAADKNVKLNFLPFECISALKDDQTFNAKRLQIANEAKIFASLMNITSDPMNGNCSNFNAKFL